MNLRNIVVYVAGPYRRTSQYGVAGNVRKAEKVAYDLWRAGFAAICPHMNTYLFTEEACAYCPLSPDNVIEGDLVILSRCDAVMMVDGWQESIGAKQEFSFAKEKDIPCFTSIESLIEHFAGAIA